MNGTNVAKPGTLRLLAFRNVQLNSHNPFPNAGKGSCAVEWDSRKRKREKSSDSAPRESPRASHEEPTGAKPSNSIYWEKGWGMRFTRDANIAVAAGAYIGRELEKNHVRMTHTGMYALVRDFLFNHYDIEKLFGPQWERYVSDLGGYESIVMHANRLLQESSDV
jgi:hypothetical protein